MTANVNAPPPAHVEDGDGALPSAGGLAALLLGAIFIGATLGLAAPSAGNALSATVDATLLAMIFLLFFELRPTNVLQGLGNVRFLALAWSANFLIVPVIGVTIAALAVPNQPLIFAGLMIYFLAPCTDWLLGFTRLARGDTTLGAALIPINLISQLILFPLWLWLFTRHSGVVDMASVPGLLAEWFVVPLIAAQAARFVLKKLLPQAMFERVLNVAGLLVPLAVAALVLQIFAVNIGAIAAHLTLFAPLLLAIFLFFTATYLAGEGLSRLAKLSYPQHALLTMTMAARNAPLMLAITAVAVPDQPMILVALVIGMLIEIPHLTALKQLLLRQHARRTRATA